MPRRLTQASLSTGARQLADADPDLGGVLDRLGEPPMWGRRPGFSALVRIILEQQGVPGLGPWSVDIYYLMALRRPDVWPRGDLALALALREVKRLDDLPTKDEQQALASAWAPWRSVAARLLWAHYLAARGQYPARPDNKPFQSDGAGAPPLKR